MIFNSTTYAKKVRVGSNYCHRDTALIEHNCTRRPVWRADCSGRSEFDLAPRRRRAFGWQRHVRRRHLCCVLLHLRRQIGRPLGAILAHLGWGWGYRVRVRVRVRVGIRVSWLADPGPSPSPNPNQVVTPAGTYLVTRYLLTQSALRNAPHESPISRSRSRSRSGLPRLGSGLGFG